MKKIKPVSTEPQDAFPPNTNQKNLIRFGELARCPACNINYPIEDRFWQRTDDGTYCVKCVDNKYYLVVLPDVIIETSPLLHNY